MSRSYSRTVHLRAPSARSVVILGVATALVSGAVVGRAAMDGRDTPTAQAQEAPIAQAQEAPVIQATPLVATPEAESPAPETPDVAAAEPAAEFPAIPDVAEATQETTPAAPEPSGFVACDTVVVNADGLNVRTAPGLNGDIAVILPPGLPATVVAGPTVADNFTWYQLEANGVTGWSAGEFLAPAGSILAFAAQAPAVPLFAVGSPVVVADGDLNLRADAGLGGAIQDQLPTGTAATVVGGPMTVDGSTWYQLDVDGSSGWSAGEFLAPA